MDGGPSRAPKRRLCCTAKVMDYPSDAAEMALAPAIGSKVEATYRRGDLFEKRQVMMEEGEASVPPFPE